MDGGAVLNELEPVEQVLTSSVENMQFSRPSFTQRFVMPLLLGRLVTIDEWVVYTWCRPERVLDSTPTLQDWVASGPLLWLVDLAFQPVVPPREAVRDVFDDMKARGIAQEGERVLFHRSDSGRYGHVRI